MPRTPLTHESAPPELLTGFWGQERKGKETARGGGEEVKRKKRGGMENGTKGGRRKGKGKKREKREGKGRNFVLL